MDINRRDFLKYCGLTAAVLGLSGSELLRLEEALAATSGPTVLWLQGSSCTGCSISLLNRISTSSPTTVADLLINKINLVYHPNLMGAAGQTAAEVAKAAYTKGGYILAVEGGVPTVFNGKTCWAWNYNNVDVTFLSAVKDLASRAAAILAIGTCAGWGGIPAAPPNPTQIKGVSAAVGKPTINIAGCPPHPDWVVWVIAQLLLGNSIALDQYGRPQSLYNQTVHSRCPRRETDEANTFGTSGCLEELGCRGKETEANCPSLLWNNRASWCIDANAPCYGCTEPTFPGSRPFYQRGD
jgi:hydrogenase small subunit